MVDYTHDDVKCKACGKCCNKHWLLKLTSNHERIFFKEHVVHNTYIWTDKCPCRIDNKCDIFNHESRPSKCKEYFCEGNEI